MRRCREVRGDRIHHGVTGSTEKKRGEDSSRSPLLRAPRDSVVNLLTRTDDSGQHDPGILGFLTKHSCSTEYNGPEPRRPGSFAPPSPRALRVPARIGMARDTFAERTLAAPAVRPT